MLSNIGNTLWAGFGILRWMPFWSVLSLILNRSISSLIYVWSMLAPRAPNSVWLLRDSLQKACLFPLRGLYDEQVITTKIPCFLKVSQERKKWKHISSFHCMIQIACYVLLTWVILPSCGAEHSRSKILALKLLLGPHVTTTNKYKMSWSNCPLWIPGYVIKPRIAEKWQACEAFYHGKL